MDEQQENKEVSQGVNNSEQLQVVDEQSRFGKAMEFIGAGQKISRWILAVALVLIFFSASIAFSLLPPTSFTNGTMVLIEKGKSLEDVGRMLKKENIVRSKNIFKICARVVGGKKPLIAGEYLFDKPTPVCAVSVRLSRGISGIPAIRLTIPEGYANKDIANLLEKSFSNFDKELFLDKARSVEGYLFPDTYFLPSAIVAEGVIRLMNDNFNKKMEPWKGAIESSGRSLRDTIIMASILEREAMTEKDMSIVSGILWKRISMGMPLQVDATFMYLIGKKSSELTVNDLKMKSAYNTYQNKGLPAGPIANPGIIAIRSAILPTESPYLYYLSDNDGGMHYAKTFEEHKANKAKYLR